MLRRAVNMIPVPEFIARRSAEFYALGAVTFSILLAAALLTYHADDPSWNHSGNAHVENAVGLTGAILADICRQLFGFMTAILVIAPLGWAWRWVMKDTEFSMGWRILALMIALVAGSAALALVAAYTSTQWLVQGSGAIGIVVSIALVQVLPTLLAIGLMGVLCLVALPLALGLRLHEYIALSIILRTVTGVMVGGVASIGQMVTRRRYSEEQDEEEEAVAADDVDEANEEEDEPVLTKKRIQAKKSKKLDNQASLGLRPRKGSFTLPSLDLLQKKSSKAIKQQSESSLEQNARLLESVLMDFGVKGEIVNIRPGPVVTLYELEPAPGIKSSRVIGLADDIARSMSAISARIAVIPGRNAIGIELPNSNREMVVLRELFEDDTYENTEAKLPLVLGRDIGGEPIIADLARMPHLLVAGTTGSGKSVAINTMIMSLVYHLTPDQCKFIMIDPKMLELSIYDNIPHLLSPVVTEPGKAVVALKWAVKEMENRYRSMSNLGVRNIENYNKRLEEARHNDEELFRTVQTGFDAETGKPIMEKQALDTTPLPFIVVIVDEMADLMIVAGKEIEGSIQRLAQMARAAGIHIIMATQRPSVDVITGVIKANFPTRISFQVTSKIDSRTILGEQGAEQLLGQGDMLHMAGGGRITRVHGPFISDKEVEAVTNYLRTQGDPQYEEAVTRDEEEDTAMASMMDGEGGAEEDLYRQAKQIVIQDGKASTSYLQRRLKLGYNRAARMIDRMEEEGIVGPANHVGKREVLVR